MVDVQFRHLGNIRGPRGFPGEKGATGTFASADAHTLPASEPATVEITGPETAKSVSFGIPRGLPGLNAVPTDEAFATLMLAEDTETGRLLRSHFLTTGSEDVVPDGVTDNSDFFNNLPVSGSGTIYLPAGEILLKKAIRIPRMTQIIGRGGANLATNGTRLVFDPSIMSGGNTCSIVTNGTTWVLTVPAGHGVNPMNVIATSGFANDGFNKKGLEVTAVTETTITVACTDTPAATATGGKFHLFLVLMGRTDQNSPGCLLQNLDVIGNHNAGIGGIYMHTVQEQGGMISVGTRAMTWRGIQIDGSSDIGNNLVPLNYMMRDSKFGLSNEHLDPESVVFDEWGGIGSRKGWSDITAVGGPGAYAVFRFNATIGYRDRLHAEGARFGYLIGDEAPVYAFSLLGVTGHGTLTEGTIKIATPTTGRNISIKVEDSFRNATGQVIQHIIDEPNGYQVTDNYIGMYRTNSEGFCVENSQDPGILWSELAADKPILTVSDNPIVTWENVPRGQYLLNAVVTVVGGTGTTNVAASLGSQSGGGVLYRGQRSAESAVDGAETRELHLSSFVTVNTPGETVVLRARAIGGDATAVAATPTGAIQGGGPKATGGTLVRIGA